jgi:transcriptional regulator with XRE-family HTH domain
MLLSYGGQQEMEKRTLGSMIAELRKGKGMTQAELAEAMHVTDKAVSKWERNLSCPDVSTLPNLAQTLGVSVDEMLRVKAFPETAKPTADIPSLLLKAVSLAMGVAVTVLSLLGTADIRASVTMLAIGLACLSLERLSG